MRIVVPLTSVIVAPACPTRGQVRRVAGVVGVPVDVPRQHPEVVGHDGQFLARGEFGAGVLPARGSAHTLAPIP